MRKDTDIDKANNVLKEIVEMDDCTRAFLWDLIKLRTNLCITCGEDLGSRRKCWGCHESRPG